MTPKQRYEADIANGTLSPDVEQADIIDRLDALSAELVAVKAWQPKKASWFSRLFGGNTEVAASHGPTGLYLWGGVGRGKTHLCDLFYDALPIEQKRRFHFHRFMQRIHDDLKAVKGVENPLDRVADTWAQEARLLLLDEIHVNDITDAMLLGGLLSALFDRGVTLVTTSNLLPDDLYKEGLQRARFIPAIERIKRHTDVVEMVGETDYRLRILQTEAIYLIPTPEDGDVAEVSARMQKHFSRLSVGVADKRHCININKRDIPIKGRAGDVVWFSFEALCATARSTHDYIEIATLFHTVLISDIPVMDETKNDEARRFVNLVDEFYDRCVKVIISAAAAPDALYTGERLSFEFVRAASRLTEMQTTEYLSKRDESTRLSGA